MEKAPAPGPASVLGFGRQWPQKSLEIGTLGEYIAGNRDKVLFGVKLQNRRQNGKNAIVTFYLAMSCVRSRSFFISAKKTGKCDFLVTSIPAEAWRIATT
jgi:hypothetical protein